MPKLATRRMSAGERREEILDAAVSEFALTGLHGTSTEVIAARAGISQPYLFRLFGTKKGLFLAAVNRGFDRVEAAFQRVMSNAPEDVLAAMGEEYRALLSHREELLLQMQGYAACGDLEVEEVVRRRFAGLYRYVESVANASELEIRTFFAYGMLLNVAAAMDLSSILESEDWAKRCLKHG